MPEEETEDIGTLVEITFKELYDQDRLPSGHSFQMMPDTVEIAMKVAEIDDTIKWKHRALQAFTVTKSVGGNDLQEDGPEYVHHMLDTDVLFLSLAWSTQMNGFTMDLAQGVPCPSCSHPFKMIDFGGMKIMVRSKPVGGPNAMFPVDDIIDDELPESLKGTKILVTDPTWKDARSKVPDAAWDRPEAVILHRMATCVLTSRDGGQPRVPSGSGEVMKMKQKTIPKILKVMTQNIPFIRQELEMPCVNCKEVAIIPFEQAL